MCLYKLNNKNRCIIEKMPCINLLNSMGIREGVTISIMSRQPFGGPVVVELAGRCFAIARDVAEQIEVKEVV